MKIYIFRNLKGAEPNYHLQNTGYSIFKSKSEFNLFYGGVLPEIQIAYETFGKLNKNRDNAILLFSGLSANSHAKSHNVRFLS
jgi:homoserine acetyltransferase